MPDLNNKSPLRAGWKHALPARGLWLRYLVTLVLIAFGCTAMVAGCWLFLNNRIGHQALRVFDSLYFWPCLASWFVLGTTRPRAPHFGGLILGAAAALFLTPAILVFTSDPSFTGSHNIVAGIVAVLTAVPLGGWAGAVLLGSRAVLRQRKPGAPEAAGAD